LQSAPKHLNLKCELLEQSGKNAKIYIEVLPFLHYVTLEIYFTMSSMMIAESTDTSWQNFFVDHLYSDEESSPCEKLQNCNRSTI